MSIALDAASAPPYRRNRKPLFAACGCALLAVVLGVIGGVSLFRSGAKSVEGAQAGADRFLSMLERGDYSGARQQMTRATQTASSVDSMRDIMDVAQKRRGPATRHSALPGFYINSYNGVTQVRLAYREDFQKGQTSVQLVLSPEQGQWRVAAFSFQF